MLRVQGRCDASERPFETDVGHTGLPEEGFIDLQFAAAVVIRLAAGIPAGNGRLVGEVIDPGGAQAENDLAPAFRADERGVRPGFPFRDDGSVVGFSPGAEHGSAG